MCPLDMDGPQTQAEAILTHFSKTWHMVAVLNTFLSNKRCKSVKGFFLRNMSNFILLLFCQPGLSLKVIVQLKIYPVS